MSSYLIWKLLKKYLSKARLTYIIKLLNILDYIFLIIIVPGLGEHQINSKIRTDAYMKGYKSGSPDILILNQHHIYNGLAIELKTPMNTGRLSSNQKNYRVRAE